MRKKIQLLVVGIMMAAALAACGETATPASTTTSAATTSAATTSAAAATTSAATTSAATAATTSAATTSASTAVASGTPGSATTSASTGNSSAFALQPEAALPPMPAKTGGNFTTISLAKLAPSVHPYPSNGDYTDSWTNVSAYVFGGSLIVYNYTTLKYEFEAANALKVSDDKKTFTFTLRNDLKWSDGQPITVDDYQYAYDNAIKEDKTTPDNNYVGLDDLQKITSFKTDKTANTITATLNEVYAPELALTYVDAVIPVPVHVWQNLPFRDATKNPEILKPTVTSGPYVVVSYDPNATAVLKPNPNWYRGKPNFDQITLKSGTAAIVVDAVKTNQADWAYNFPPAQYTQAKSDQNLKVVDWSAVNGTYRFVEYNTKRAPMDDKAFRTAINYAIDRNNLIKLAENGLGAPQFSFINPGSQYYNQSVNPYTYNLDTAKKTLSDAGYKIDNGNLIGKDGKPITLTVIFPTSSNPRKLIATYLQQQLKQIGITVNVDGKEFAAYTKQLAAHDFDISLSASGGGFPDPDNFKSYVITGGQQNNTGYSNPKIDDLFKQGGVEQDPAKRKAIYDQAQQILSDDTPLFFLWNINSFSLFSSKVQGVTPNKGDRLDYNDAATRWSISQ